MMNFVIELLYNLAPYVHFVSFGLLLLAGLNIPVSEDLVYLVSGSIAATLIPENKYMIFAGCFLGSYVSDIIAYFIGRSAGRRILHIKFIKRFIPETSLVRVENYFLKYGGKTLFFGRFIPFGVRNIIFMSAGISRFNIKKFLIIDISALCITSTLLFYLGYSFGENYKEILDSINEYKLIIFTIFAISTVVYLISKYNKKKSVLLSANDKYIK